MKVKLLKEIDTANDFYGISLLAENTQEKRLIMKLVNADVNFKVSERLAANLIRKRVTIQIDIENVI